MKPCCFPAEERCVNIAHDTDEWWCGEHDGVLGPEGACCKTPAEGLCTAPEAECWYCPWDVSPLGDDVDCCFPGLNYQWLAGIRPAQCNLCAGGPSTQEDCIPPPPPNLRACCSGERYCRNVPIDDTQCEAEGGKLGPPGTCCRNPHSQPFCYHNACWLCEWEVDPMGFAGSCCFAALNYHWEANIKWEQCWACNDWGVGGQTEVFEEDCQAPEPEPECIDAPREDRPNPAIHDDEGTLLQWTLDTISTVVFARSATEDVLSGYQYPVSVHLIRPKQADTPAESCGHASGRKTMLDDGYVYVETCSQPDRTSEDSFRRSYGLMRTFLPEEDTPLAQANRALGMQDGYQYSVACIRLPWWTEATYRSYMARCGTDPA